MKNMLSIQLYNKYISEKEKEKEKCKNKYELSLKQRQHLNIQYLQFIRHESKNN